MFDPDISVFVIAEAGINHNGDLDLAIDLVDVAAEAGATAVKFQTFDARELVIAGAPKAPYQVEPNTRQESQQEMLARCQLDRAAHQVIKTRAEEQGLIFLSTAFDSPSLTFLINELGMKVLKIPSGEITNGPLLLEYAQSGRDLILSTGMSTQKEVAIALSVIAFGLIGEGEPSNKAFEAAFLSSRGQAELLARVTLLHCTTQYPASLDSVNLRAMDSLREVFGLRVGYSDHTAGLIVAFAAVARGARVIEKHFTLDKALPGPDQVASLNPQELRDLVQGIRVVEQALGSKQKELQSSETENRAVARKSLIAKREIMRGELFSEQNISAKRPGTGRSPMDYWDLVGSLSEKAYKPDAFI